MILVLKILIVALIDDLFNLTSEYDEHVGANDQDLDQLLKSTPLKSQLM